MAQGQPFGGLQISDGDEAAIEWMDEARKRLEFDAEFVYRVESLRQVMHAAYVNAPGRLILAVALLLDEKVRRANGLR